MSTAIVIFISYAAICTVIYLALYSWLLQNEENNAIRTADDLTSFLIRKMSPFQLVSFKAIQVYSKR